MQRIAPSNRVSLGCSPSEERLFTLGWKDNFYFYGDCEAYMVQPMGARERRLLKQHASSLRGHSFRKQVLVEDETEGGNVVHPELCEEDAMLPNDPPACLLSLPACLSEPSADMTLRTALQERRQQTCMQAQLDLLRHDILPFDRQHARLFARGVSRHVDPLLNEDIDPVLFTDYLPMLRVMAVTERALEHAFGQDAEGESGRARRTTRRSAKARQHYWQVLSPPLWHDRDDGEAAKVGAQLANYSLSVINK